MNLDGYPASYYAATAEGVHEHPRLEGAQRADVCVIGGGFTGLSAALNLAEQGFDVVLLEAERIGFGASGRNGGLIGSGQRKDALEMDNSSGWSGRASSGISRRRPRPRFGNVLRNIALIAICNTAKSKGRTSRVTWVMRKNTRPHLPSDTTIRTRGH